MPGDIFFVLAQAETYKEYKISLMLFSEKRDFIL